MTNQAPVASDVVITENENNPEVGFAEDLFR
jgi:hypothetical protein